MKARLQQTLRAYGRTAAAFHSCVFLATLSGSYAAIRAGADMDALLARVPFVDLSRVDREAGTLALAYVSTVATGPARGALTLAASPVLARLLARARRLK